MSENPYREKIIKLEKIKSDYEDLVRYDYDDLDEEEKAKVDNVDIEDIESEINRLYKQQRIWQAKEDWGDEWEDYI